MNQTYPLLKGNWLPKNKAHVAAWIKDLKTRTHLTSHSIAQPIADFKELVENDPVLLRLSQDMFTEAKSHKELTPLETSEVNSFDEFLVLLNHIMTQAPECTEFLDPKTGALEPCGLIGFPINALLDWPMATDSGYAFFANELVNQQFKKILTYWSLYLSSPASRSVLVENHPDRIPKVFGWLSDNAQKEMVTVACQAEASDSENHNKPFEHFFNCDPTDKHYGFKSWDDFFTRTFKDGVRPVAEGDDVIANACESAPLQVVTNVAKSSSFWLKGQPYSLENMMDFDPLAEQFVGGTVYQAFLSALSYHRWNSPVSGTIKKTFMVNGSYYLGNRYQGFNNPDGADDSAPNNSQPFLTAVATRAVIFIESDNPKIGLMCFIAIGMAEVSSCAVTVEEGQHINKGDELGMFHFGGSTHCLIFKPDVELEFDFHNTAPGLDATNIPVCSRIATVKNK
ncbi:phosphatidylserine decarboxylase family protein [Photobacterium andalusiense]|uniref:Phosphatidylserine decarboxylase proenzyme n=1 Tax=Photobacterium andalusiense TaxID=2204296 RepID=A0A1Y6MC06_9GAMM|nr:phosphatidylserine decarboxylase family protein [Photobacterium andalusiense]SMY33280.1 Phosphatidylserine decarboxylase proenzyme [Photobacterium andalusiense]